MLVIARSRKILRWNRNQVTKNQIAMTALIHHEISGWTSKDDVHLHWTTRRKVVTAYGPVHDKISYLVAIFNSDYTILPETMHLKLVP